MIVETAPAKLNLALHVRARREDGYHELETLFAFAADGDLLHVVPAPQPAFSIVGPFAEGLDATADNLVIRARDAFVARFGPVAPLAITLDKRLPVASGIGGGSADAAAMLRVLARMNGVALDDEGLLAVALAIGSDVPACLLGRTTIGRGRGEALAEVAGVPGCPVLLVNPGVALSTRAVFAGWDGIDRGPLPDGDALDVARRGRNDLQPAACALVPPIDRVLDELAVDAMLARMSGSGATCFGLYEDGAARTLAAARVRERHPTWWCLETALV